MERATNNRGDRRASGRWVALLILAVLWAPGCDYLGLGGGDSKEQEESKEGTSEASDSKKESQKEAESKADAGDEAMESPPGLESNEGDAGRARPTRNPFAPQVAVEQEEEDQPEKTPAPKLGPLRRYSISQYRLAGVMSEITVPTAMFIAPDGKGYMMKEGESLGKRGGVIKDIRKNEVDIELPAEEGEEDTTITTVKLRTEALPAESDDSALTKQEREMLERLREKQEGEASSGAEAGGGASPEGLGGSEELDAGGGARP